MNEQPRRPLGPQPWNVVRDKLDQSLPFANMRDTPYYRDCIWEQFSAGEYKRRYDSLRAKMREHKLDAVVVPGGPSHWSFGAGMTWLTGHWEWHSLCCYVLVPLDGEPTMIYSMGGTHAEAVRRQVAVAVQDVRHAGKLCQDAMEAMVARARPGVKEYELRAAAGAAILEGGGDIDFLIIGSTPMDNPAMIFGNPRPSARVLKKGDIINMELAAGYRGYSAQIGSPICVGEPTDMVRKFWDDITLPAFQKMAAEIVPGKPTENMRIASKFFRDNGVQSRPTQCHGIDLVTDNPHISAEHVKGEEIDMVLKPGMIIMAEPNPITPDGNFGIFLGHTFIVTNDGHEVVDQFPLEIAVAKA